jgi:NAD(P)H-hydrate repair Nnr-like enzyme with NAD(P)H-hydrate dehydratase domain
MKNKFIKFDENCNKYTRGKTAIIGGSTGMTGAVCLASNAASKSGCGLVCAVVPEELNNIFEIKLTEGCFEDLSALKTLIQRISPLYEEGVDWDAQAVGRILADSKMPLEDAAKRLMGC